MEVFIDGNKYLRNVEEENVFSEFSIPKDTSYACGKNDLNIFVQKATNDTDRVGVRDAYKFYGIQVCKGNHFKMRTLLYTVKLLYSTP